MKKIKNKINYFVKLILALSLLLNNLMPLSTVFADELDNNQVTDNEQIIDNANDTNTDSKESIDDSNKDNNSVINTETDEKQTNTDTTNNEGNDNVVADETNNTEKEIVEEEFSVTIEDKKLIIKYTNVDILTDEVLTISEDFEYLDSTTYGGLYSQIELTDEVKEKLKDGYTFDSELLNENTYDGTYTVLVTVGEKSESASLKVASEESGFEYNLYTVDDKQLTPNKEGKYIITSDTEKLIVKGKLAIGGISPNDVYSYDGEEISLEDLLNGKEVANIELNGYLYGEFLETITGSLASNDGEETLYSKTFNIVYGNYQENTDVLNESAKNVELDKNYIFNGKTEHGVIYVLDELKEEDIKIIIDDALIDDENITYTFEEGVLTLTDKHGVIITYTEVYPSEDTKISTKIANDNEEIASGDEFTINYLVTLKDYAINGVNGLVTYDKELLELVTVESEKFTGVTKDDMLLFLGDSIQGTVVTDDEGNESIEETDYIILKLTFKALKAGTSKITVEKAKFYNNYVYYENDNEVETEVVINSSTDNTLSSLTIGDEEIKLEEGKLEYELNVPNDVTEVNVEALLSSDNAEIVSIVSPEELSEGENTITIVIKAENGDEAVYTIKVSREASPKEETTTTAYAENYYQEPTSTVSEDDKKEVIKEKDQDEDDKKDDVKDKKENKTTRMIVIALISLAVIGLIYLIFRDDNDSIKPVTPNKPIDNKLKKENEVKNNNNYNNNKKQNKKGR